MLDQKFTSNQIILFHIVVEIDIINLTVRQNILAIGW